MSYYNSSKPYGMGGSGGYSSPYYPPSPYNSMLLGRLDFPGSGFSGGSSSSSSGLGLASRSPLYNLGSYGYGGFNNYGSSAYSPSTYLATSSPGLAKKYGTSGLPTISEHSSMPRISRPPKFNHISSHIAPLPPVLNNRTNNKRSGIAVWNTEDIDVTTPRRSSRDESAGEDGKKGSGDASESSPGSGSTTMDDNGQDGEDHQGTATPGEIRGRETQFGTIRRGRTVIRIQTQHLKENPYLNTMDLDRREKRPKKTAGEKMKEKWAIQSKKKKHSGYRRPTLSDIRAQQEVLQREIEERQAALLGNSSSLLAKTNSSSSSSSMIDSPPPPSLMMRHGNVVDDLTKSVEEREDAFFNNPDKIPRRKSTKKFVLLRHGSRGSAPPSPEAMMMDPNNMMTHHNHENTHHHHNHRENSTSPDIQPASSPSPVTENEKNLILNNKQMGEENDAEGGGGGEGGEEDDGGMDFWASDSLRSKRSTMVIRSFFRPAVAMIDRYPYQRETSHPDSSEVESIHEEDEEEEECDKEIENIMEKQSEREKEVKSLKELQNIFQKAKPVPSSSLPRHQKSLLAGGKDNEDFFADSEETGKESKKKTVVKKNVKKGGTKTVVDSSSSNSSTYDMKTDANKISNDDKMIVLDKKEPLVAEGENVIKKMKVKENHKIKTTTAAAAPGQADIITKSGISTPKSGTNTPKSKSGTSTPKSGTNTPRSGTSTPEKMIKLKSKTNKLDLSIEIKPETENNSSSTSTSNSSSGTSTPSSTTKTSEESKSNSPSTPSSSKKTPPDSGGGCKMVLKKKTQEDLILNSSKSPSPSPKQLLLKGEGAGGNNKKFNFDLKANVIEKQGKPDLFLKNFKTFKTQQPQFPFKIEGMSVNADASTPTTTTAAAATAKVVKDAEPKIESKSQVEQQTTSKSLEIVDPPMMTTASSTTISKSNVGDRTNASLIHREEVDEMSGKRNEGVENVNSANIMKVSHEEAQVEKKLTTSSSTTTTPTTKKKTEDKRKEKKDIISSSPSSREATASPITTTTTTTGNSSSSQLVNLNSSPTSTPSSPAPSSPKTKCFPFKNTTATTTTNQIPNATTAVPPPGKTTTAVAGAVGGNVAVVDALMEKPKLLPWQIALKENVLASKTGGKTPPGTPPRPSTPTKINNKPLLTSKQAGGIGESPTVGKITNKQQANSAAATTTPAAAALKNKVTPVDNKDKDTAVIDSDKQGNSGMITTSASTPPPPTPPPSSSPSSQSPSESNSNSSSTKKKNVFGLQNRVKSKEKKRKSLEAASQEDDASATTVVEAVNEPEVSADSSSSPATELQQSDTVLVGGKRKGEQVDSPKILSSSNSSNESSEPNSPHLSSSLSSNFSPSKQQPIHKEIIVEVEKEKKQQQQQNKKEHKMKTTTTSETETEIALHSSNAVTAASESHSSLSSLVQQISNDSVNTSSAVMMTDGESKSIILEEKITTNYEKETTPLSVLPNPIVQGIIRDSLNRSSSDCSSGSVDSDSPPLTPKSSERDGSTSTTSSSTLSAGTSGSSRRMPSPPSEDSDEDQEAIANRICPTKNRPKFRKYEVHDFQFLKVLGKGSFGKVLLAEMKGTDCYFAIKCLKKDVVLEDDDVECTMIERKVLLMGSKHPYLCKLMMTFQTESHLFFVMEYLNGGDLMFHIQQSGRFTEDRARFYAAEIFSGLKFLHKKGIIYRDLKLDNILLDFEGHIRIADFGMCKLQIYLDRTADTFCGTPDYMSPEIIKGLKYNQCVDLWAFGVLLYEMMVGQSPFSGCDEDELFWSICNEAVRYPRFLSREAKRILEMLLEKDASKRLGTPGCQHGEVKEQPFFQPINWDRLERRELEPPFKPKLKHSLDVQYFDTTFTKEAARLTPVDKDILRSMDQTQFEGFSYTNPHTTD